PDFSLAVQRDDSLRQVAIEIDDSTGHDLATELALGLRAIPGVVRSRRTASVKFRSRPQDPDTTIRVVAPIAAKYRLNQLERKGMFTVATFGSPGLQVDVDFFESDGTMKVLIEDFSWHAEFADIEQALRAGLNADGGVHGQAAPNNSVEPTPKDGAAHAE